MVASKNAPTYFAPEAIEMTDLSANEMVSYANAMSERNVELERENERLKSEVTELKDSFHERLTEEVSLATSEAVEKRNERIADQHDKIRRLQSRVEALEEVATDLQKFVDLQAEDEGLWGVAQYASEAYIQRGLRGCHQFIEESLAKLQESDSDG